jgi:hypothetical protein
VQRVYVRKGKDRLPIKGLWGPRIASVFERREISDKLVDHAHAVFGKELPNKLEFYVNRIMSGAK